GADFSLGMLAVAREKMTGLEEARRVRLMDADALGLPFEARTFACVTSAFLLRKLADLQPGLREMRRVSRPGGRVVALEITQMTAPGFSALFRLYFHHVVPWVGQLVGGDRQAYTYLPQSVDRLVTPGELSALMEKVGLRGVSYRRLGLGTVTVHTGIAGAALPLGAGVLVQRASHHPDLLGAPVLVVERHDIARMQALEIPRGALVRDHQGLAAHEVGARLGRAAHAERARCGVDGDHLEAVVLGGIGQALGHGG